MMNAMTSLFALALAALPAVTLLRVEDSKPQDSGKQDPAAQDIAALVKKLGDSDYATRKEAFRALEKIGGAAREALVQAQKDGNAQARWSASLLLGRIDDAAAQASPKTKVESGKLRETTPAPDDDATDDPAPAKRGERRWRTRSTPEDALQEMRETIRRLESDRGSWFPGGPFDRWDFPDFDFGGSIDLAPGSSYSRTSVNDGEKESLSIRVDADGHVTAEEEKGGQTTKIEADSIEAFKREHPELLEDFGPAVTVRPHAALLPGRRDQVPGRQDPMKVERLPRDVDDPLWPDRVEAEKALPPAEKPRLGLMLGPVAPDVAAWLELEDGVGLQVMQVLDGMPAQKLGVKTRDIIIAVNGKPVTSVDDIRTALGDQDPGKAEITVIRRGNETKLQPRKASTGQAAR